MPLRLIAIVVILIPTSAFANELVSVALRDGRVLTGQIDARTSRQHLWLRVESPSISLSSAVPWTSIVRAQWADQTLRVKQLRRRAIARKTKLPDDFLLLRTGGDAELQQPAARLAAAAGRQPRVVSLQIEAALANLDRDVAPDGFRVWIYPLDGDGRITPVHGTLSVRLIGEWVRGRRTRKPFDDLQRWSVQVSAADFTAAGAVYELPLRTIQPEFQLDLSTTALLNARLGAFGHGNFEASLPVRIRPYERIRDRLQLLERTRFFPNELTDRTRR